MKRTLATATLIAAIAAAWLPTLAVAAQPQARTVVIVLAPYLSWSDVTETATPTMWSLAGSGAAGDINARSRSREPGDSASPLEGALTISAGTWAVNTREAPAAYNVDERYEVGTAAEAFRRMTGDQVGSNRIVYLGMPLSERTNSERSFEVVLGTLGSSVEQAGGLTAAIGNSDVGYVTGEQRRVRPAALAAMNKDGLVALGDVSARLLKEDPRAPFGIKTDLDRFARVLQGTAEAVAKKNAPALVVLDSGDLYRAVKFSEQVTPEIARSQRLAALADLDRVVAMAAKGFPDATLMVVSQATGDPDLGQPEGLGPVLVSGERWEGYLTSSSTQRPGLVTNLDVTATALEELGLERPVQVVGNRMSVVVAPEAQADRIERLVRMDETAVSVDAAKPGVANTFVALTVVVLVLSSFVLVRSREWTLRGLTRWVAGLRAMLLLVLCVPLASWLMFTWRSWPSTPGDAALSLVVTTLVVWILSLVLMWRAPLRVPVAILSLATVLVLLVDQWLGAPASFTNFFGYSPLLAARFYGLGNEAAAIMFGAAVVGMALLFDEWPDSAATRYGKLFGIPLLGALVVFTSAAPFFGANIGVAVWGVVGFALAWVLMNGRHVSWKLVFWVFVGVVIVIAGFAAIDLFGGGQQTHLGRALQSAEQGGVSELWQIVARKAETNARVLTRTNWAYILIATLAFLGLMRWRPHGDFAATLIASPDFADAITVSLIAGLVAYFTEDSGIVIPALEVFYVGVALAWLMLSRALELAQAREGTEPRASDR